MKNSLLCGRSFEFLFIIILMIVFNISVIAPSIVFPYILMSNAILGGTLCTTLKKFCGWGKLFSEYSHSVLRENEDHSLSFLGM